MLINLYFRGNFGERSELGWGGDGGWIEVDIRHAKRRLYQLLLVVVLRTNIYHILAVLAGTRSSKCILIYGRRCLALLAFEAHSSLAENGYRACSKMV